MKKKNYKTFKDEELKTVLANERRELLKLKFDIAGSRGKNTKDIRNIKKNIARILTETNERK